MVGGEDQVAKGCLMEPLLDQAEGVAALDRFGAVAVAVTPASSPKAIRATRRRAGMMAW
jgi:hypothetical protein